MWNADKNIIWNAIRFRIYFSNSVRVEKYLFRDVNIIPKENIISSHVKLYPFIFKIKYKSFRRNVTFLTLRYQCICQWQNRDKNQLPFIVLHMTISMSKSIGNEKEDNARKSQTERYIDSCYSAGFFLERSS